MTIKVFLLLGIGFLTKTSSGQTTTYEVSDYEMTWLDAVEYCGSRGATLVQIPDQETQTKVTSYLTNADSSGGRLFWTGLTDLGHEGTYKWINFQAGTYTPATYFAWNFGEPNDGDGSSDCVHLEHAGKNRLWDDIPCSDRSIYALCQRVI